MRRTHGLTAEDARAYLCVNASQRRWIVPHDTELVPLDSQGYTGYYASRDGYILSPSGRKMSGTMDRRRGKEVAHRVRLTMTCAGERRYTTVHRLVCEAYHGPPPHEGAMVRHLNGNPTDNRPENLAWGDHDDNLLDLHLHVAVDVLKALSEHKDALVGLPLRAPVRQLIKAVLDTRCDFG